MPPPSVRDTCTVCPALLLGWHVARASVDVRCTPYDSPPTSRVDVTARRAITIHREDRDRQRLVTRALGGRPASSGTLPRRSLPERGALAGWLRVQPCSAKVGRGCDRSI